MADTPEPAEPAGAEADADGDAEVAEALGCGLVDPPGILAMPMAPTEQAVDEPDPVLAAPAMLHRDDVWTSVAEPATAAEECDGRAAVTWSWACVATPLGARAT